MPVWPTASSTGVLQFYSDVTGYAEAYALASKEIFTTRDELNIETCSADSTGVKARKLNDIEHVRSYFAEKSDNDLAKYQPSNSRMHIISVHQLHSRSPLALSQEAMTIILSRLKVFPEFVNVLSQFKLQVEELCTQICSFGRSEKGSDRDPIFETSYILRHVELNHRPGSPDWSLRQMGVYQQYNATTKASSCVLLNPSCEVQRRIKELSGNGSLSELSLSWVSLHEVFLGTLNRHWNSCFEQLNSRFNQIDVYFAKGGKNLQAQLTFKDLQALHYMIDFVNRIEYSLQMNIEILHLLSSEANCRAEKEGPHSAGQYERFQDRIKGCIMEQTFLRDCARYMYSFADRRAGQFRDAIALQDSHSMMSMNEKTIREAQTMRTITILALIYLPASFTATFLDMGYIHVASLSGIMRIHVDQEMWFYLAITVPLMVATILSWRLWELKMRYKSAMKPALYEDVEKNKDV